MSTSTIIFTQSSRQRFEKAHILLDAVFAVFIALSPLVLGGTHPIAAVILCAAFALLCAASLGLHAVYNVAPRRAWPLYALGALCAWTLLRSTTLGAWTNPMIVRDAWSIWPEISARGGIAPGRAALWVIRTLTFTLAAWYGTQRFARTTRLHYIARAIVGGAYLIVLVGIAQHLSQASNILWFYDPLDWSRVVRLAGPFVNPNQAGAYVGLAAVIAASSARYNTQRTAQILYGILTLPLLIYVFYVGARGATLAALAALGAWSIFCALEGASARRRGLFIGIFTVTITALAIGLLYFHSPVDRWIQDGTLRDKIDIWRAARQVPIHSGMLGLGPRGFQDVFAALGLNRTHVWVEDPESGILQLLIEHGPLIALAVVLTIAWMIVRLAARDKHRRPALVSGLCAVAIYVILETITGMGLHASAYLVAVGALTGVAFGRISQGARAADARKHLAPSAALLALAIVALAQSASAVHTSLEDSRVPLTAVLQDLPLDDPRIDAEARMYARRTPGRAALVEQMARVYSARENHADALHMAHALQRIAPRYANTQRTVLRVLIAADESSQACRQFQVYRERFGGLPTQELIAWHESSGIEDACFKSADEQLLVARAFLQANKADLADSMILSLVQSPSRASDDALIEALRVSQRMDAPLLAEPWVDELLTRTNLKRAQWVALEQWSQRADNPALAFRIATQARQSFPSDPEFFVLYLEQFLALTDTWDDLAQYRHFLGEVDNARALARGNRALDLRLALLAAAAAWEAEQWDDAQEFYQELENAPLSKAEAVQVMYRLGEISRQNNDYFHAQKYYRRVLDRSPKHRGAQDALEEIGN